MRADRTLGQTHIVDVVCENDACFWKPPPLDDPPDKVRRAARDHVVETGHSTIIYTERAEHYMATTYRWQ
jgi:hypothetical protein